MAAESGPVLDASQVVVADEIRLRIGPVAARQISPPRSIPTRGKQAVRGRRSSIRLRAQFKVMDVIGSGGADHGAAEYREVDIVQTTETVVADLGTVEARVKVDQCGLRAVVNKL